MQSSTSLKVGQARNASRASARSALKRDEFSRLKPIAQAVVLLLLSGGAHAQTAFSGAWFAAKGAAQSTATTTGRLPNGMPLPSTNPASLLSAERTAQSVANLSAAAHSIAAFQAAQAAARQAALAAPGGVPDGLAAGGLKVDANPLTKGWLNADAPVQTVGADGRVTVGIRQSADKAILNWETFNVGKNTTVDFQQQSSWSVLNRVNDPLARPSQIAGQIKSDGAVYLINRNGIIFTGSSQVNTRSLTASALDIYGGSAIEDTRPAGMTDAQWQAAKIAARDQRFKDGLLSDPKRGNSSSLTFSDGTNLNAYTDRAMAGEVYAQGDGVTVKAGAQISVAKYGQALLLGHNVVNQGTVSAPDGQVLMVAGRATALSDGTKRMNGISESETPIHGYVATVDRGGQIVNSGLIQAARGNVALLGQNIAQNGVLAVTNGAETQGSIILSASGGLPGDPGYRRDDFGGGMVHGTVSFGSGSLSAILPDDSGDMVTGNPYKASAFEVYGNQILLQDDSRIYAPGGKLSLITNDKFSYPFNDLNKGMDGRIYLGRNAVVDVSGLRGVEIAMKRNTIEAELRANELRDNPVLRNSALRGQKVWFDIRNGGKLTDGTGVADLSGYYDLIKRDVAEFMTVGGAIAMSSAEIIAKQGSVIDVSGGSVRYLDGYVKSTGLIGPGGQRVSIENAQAYVPYSLENMYTSDHPRWGVSTGYASPLIGTQSHFEAGYDEGRSAGSLTITVDPSIGYYGATSGHVADFARIFEGQIKADVLRGQRQVDAPAGAGVTDVTRVWHERPAAAALGFNVNTNFNYNTPFNNPLGGDITIADRAPLLGEGFKADSALFDYTSGVTPLISGIVAHKHVLPAAWFDGATFGTVTLFSGRSSDPSYVDAAGAPTWNPVMGPDGKFLVGSPTPPAGVLTIGAGVTANLGDYGSLRFIGRQANIDGTIKAPGGSVLLETVAAPLLVPDQEQNYWADIPKAMLPGTHLGSSGVIDVAGRWTNDYRDALSGTAPSAPVLNGGKVQIVGYNIVLDQGSLIDVGGGARLAVDGKTLKAGDGGAIVLDNSGPYLNGPSQSTPPPGGLGMNGTLAGYALGKGGTLTVNTPFDVVVANTPLMADGVLLSGQAAPKDLTLAADVVIPAGGNLPFPAPFTPPRNGAGQWYLPAGIALAAPAAAIASPPIVTQADWVVPVGVSIFTARGRFTAGTTVPINTSIYGFRGNLPAGFVAPAAVFPNGILTQDAVRALNPAGPVTAAFTIAAGTVVPTGAAFAQTVRVTPPVTFIPSFFSQGGFSGYALSGAQGTTVLSGTVIAPSVDRLVLTSPMLVPTGARLADLALQPGSAVSIVNSSALPPGQQGPMSLLLSTAPIDFSTVPGSGRPSRLYNVTSPTWMNAKSYPGKLTLDEGAAIRMAAGSSVVFDSLTDLFIGGTVSTPGGLIKLAPYNPVPSDPVSRIRIGDHAQLLAGGYQGSSTFNGVERRSVEAGGTIKIGSLSGFGSTVMIGNGAVLDVSGVQGVTDVAYGDSGDQWTVQKPAPYAPISTDGAAGVIEIRAASGVVAGDMRLAPGGTNGRGGSLRVTAATDNGLIVRQSGAGLAPVTPASAVPGFGLTLIADSISRSGLDDLALITVGWSAYNFTGLGIMFAGDVSLQARRSITLSAPQLQRAVEAGGTGRTVDISAAYVALNGSTSFMATGADVFPTNLKGALTVHAGLIDVAGYVSLGCRVCTSTALLPLGSGGFDSATFVAAGDIRLSSGEVYAGNLSAVNTTAGLVSGGALTLNAAQIYVASGSMTPRERLDADPGFLISAGRSITIGSNGAAAPVPLTFGQRLTLRAPVIDQGGVLRAPLGQIRLEAAQALHLLPGSLTSVSLEGITVPFGYTTLLGSRNQFQGYDYAGQAPTKSITLSGSDVQMDKGAVVDVSGGGDVLGLTFTAGNGGSKNVLATASGYYAIVPALGMVPAPLAAAPELKDARLTVGDAVWLDAAPGLAAGYYTLLPAAYAVLDGGILVRPMDGAFASSAGTALRADGAVVTSGYRTVAGTPIRDAAYSNFQVMDGKTWRQYSEISTTSFNQTAQALAAAAGLPVRTAADPGAVLLAASNSLALNGTGRFGSAPGALAGLLDVSAARIALTSDGTAAPAGYLNVDADQLTGFGAGSILIGGMRARTTNLGFNDVAQAPIVVPRATTITTTASDVLVADGTRVNGSELMLAATGTLTIGDGAALNTTGAVAGATALSLSGDGAFLRQSGGGRVDILRTGVTGLSGMLTVGNNATFTTAGSLSFDVTKDLGLANSAVLDSAGLDLSASRLNLGDVPAAAVGTTLSAATVQRLSASSNLLLRGRDSINFYGDFTLGARDVNGKATLAALTLDSALVQGHASAGATKLTVGTLTLANSGAASAAPVAGTSALMLDVDRLVLSSGASAVGGYRALTGKAGEIVTVGQGGLTSAGDVDLSVGRVTTVSATDPVTGSVTVIADYALRATGDLALRQGIAPVAASQLALGGKLTLAGANLLFDTAAAMPAGVLDLQATGGSLTLGSHAVLDASGRTVDFRGVAKSAPGGVVRLTALGDVNAANGALLDVSGATRGGAAGSIAVTAGGAAALLGQLRGGAASGEDGGRFTLDASVADFAALNARLNDGMFNGARDIRLRSQDVMLAAGERIDAHNVSLRADTGQVRIGGTIAAGGSAASVDGGSVRLTGGNGVLLEASARIDAQAANGDAAAGSVELAAEGGRATLAAGSVIDVSGGREGSGRVMVRAARSGSGVAADLNGSVQGAREKTLVGMQDYSAATIDAALVSNMVNGAASWLAGAAPVPGWDVGAGMMVRSTGDLTVGSTIDLGRINGAGYLGLAAVGDIKFDATLSDGFASAARNAALDSGKSFSYGMESGRDIKLAADQMIRTGTGDIRIAAGRDLVLGNNASVIYTAGSKTPTAAGFDASLYTATKVKPTDRVIGEFPTLGGNIVLNAGRDILAPLVKQTASAWLFRYGSSTWNGNPSQTRVADQTSWSVVYRNFESGVGALGGGNVTVQAGRNIKDLAVAIPTTGHMTTPVGGVASAQAMVVRGGGDLDLRAGGDLQGGAFLLGRGHAEVAAAGSIGGSGELTDVRIGSASWQAPERRSLNPLFGLMDADARVIGGGNVTVEAAYDPMMQGQICENLVGTCSAGSTDNSTGSAYYSNTGRTALNAISLGGNLRYLDNGWAATEVSRTGKPAWQVLMQEQPSFRGMPLAFLTGSRIAPGTLRFAALSGDVTLAPWASIYYNGLTLAAAPNGTLEVLAAKNLNVFYEPISTPIILQDIAPDYVRGALAPMKTAGAYTYNTPAILAEDFNANVGNNFYRGYTPLHAGDAEPLRLVALSGYIVNPIRNQAYWTVSAPKPVDVYAGRDIVRASVIAQNNNGGQTSQIAAGRDLLFPAITLLGEGQLWVEAGRNVEVEALQIAGIRSAGNTADMDRPGYLAPRDSVNLALPDRGANISVIAGTAQGADYAGFAKRYLDPANLADPAFGLSYAANAGKVVRTYEKDLSAFLSGLGYKDVTPQTQSALFAALPERTRKAFLQQVLVDELRATGIDYNDMTGTRFHQYTRGYDALARLFPASATLQGRENPAGGNIALNSRLIESRSGGSITMMAPYGRVLVGDPGTESSVAAQGGVITRRGGDVQVVSNGNVDLYLSRVFTLGGGDLLMWTSNGDITAGAGAKTSVSNVPLKFTMDRNGEVTVDAFGLATGAGIGVLDAFSGKSARSKSRMDLMAFKGEVNAGDAGIRVVGDLNIAALRVVGADNIQVTEGDAIGVPAGASVNTSALTAASAAGAGVSQAAEAMAQNDRRASRQALASVITVQVLGFGEERPNDNARQGAPADRKGNDVSYDAGSAFQLLGNGRLNEREKMQLTATERSRLEQ